MRKLRYQYTYYVNAKYLNNICFADDVLQLAENVENLKIIIINLNNAARSHGLNINVSKNVSKYKRRYSNYT